MSIKMNSIPEMKVYIQGDCFIGSIRMMLAQYGGIRFRPAKSVEDSDMILYTGGADVNPNLYAENPIAGTYCDLKQDISDMECWKKARELNKFQVGICRGAQFLNVVNGGKLWQHVNHHAGKNHLVQDCLSNKVFEVSSLHHQGIILARKKAVLLAFCNDATEKRAANSFWKGIPKGPQSTDVEAFWYADTRSLGVQWHPECGPDECIEWFFHYIESYKETNKLEVAA